VDFESWRCSFMPNARLFRFQFKSELVFICAFYHLDTASAGAFQQMANLVFEDADRKWRVFDAIFGVIRSFSKFRRMCLDIQQTPDEMWTGWLPRQAVCPRLAF
jgi:hypothetical protein